MIGKQKFCQIKLAYPEQAELSELLVFLLPAQQVSWFKYSEASPYMNSESWFGLTSPETSSKAECQAQGYKHRTGFEEGSILILKTCQCTMKTQDLLHPAWEDLNVLVTPRDPAGASQTSLSFRTG